MQRLDLHPSNIDKRMTDMAKITIDGKEYDSKTLSEDAQTNLQNIQFCEQKMAELKREIAIAQTARNAYTVALKSQLPKDS
jgi:LPS O-antigen subunit length determinant protein (WzzB/FepE family)